MNQQSVIAHKGPIHGSQNLPVRPPEALVGRDSDLPAAHLALRAGTAVLLYGPAGIGKTALAAALAAGYAELPGGVVWLENAGDSLWSLVNKTARAYSVAGASTQQEFESLVAQVRDLLHTNRPLIVLDGLAEVEPVRDFIRTCGQGISLLFTHHSMVAGPWTPLAVKPLLPDDALTMLTDLAGVSLDTGLVRQLENVLAGQPLAISMAARQLAAGAPVEDFLAQMPDISDVPANRVMAILMAAYRLLPSALQGMVMLLGTAFAGGASQELLSDVSGAPPDILHASLSKLVPRGFAVESSVYQQPYFSTHDMIGLFASAFLRGKGQLEVMQKRHFQGLLTYIRRHISQNDAPSQDRLAAEFDTILAAGRVAAGQDWMDLLHELLSLLESDGFEDFAEKRGFQGEIRWLHQLAETPDLAGEGLLTGMGFPGDLTVESPASPPVLSVVETVEDAEAPPEETLAPPELLPEPESVSVIEAGDEEEVALPELELPSLESAPPLVVGPGEQALKTYQADGNVDDELAALESLAQLSMDQQAYDQVLAYIDKGTALAQQTDNPQREGHMLILLGDLQVQLGREDGAETAYKEAIKALSEIEAWLDVSTAQDKLADLYIVQDRLEDAAATLEQNITIFEREGQSAALFETLDIMGDLYADLMQWDKSQGYHMRALALAQSERKQRGVFEQLIDLGALAEARGALKVALPRFRQALYVAFELDDEQAEGQAVLALARLQIDNAEQLNRTVQLLEAAVQRLPEDTEAQRLLRRANSRRERLVQAGVTLVPAEANLRDYAAVFPGEGETL